MERKKTMTMNWKGIDDDDDEESFFESLDGDSSSDDEEFQESRMSFSANSQRFRIMTRKMSTAPMAVAIPDFDYDMWMAAPGSITERRKRLLYGMGLNENKESLRLASIAIGRAMTRKFENNAAPPSPSPDKPKETKVPDPHDAAVVYAAASCDQSKTEAADTTASCDQQKTESAPPPSDEPKTEQFPVPVPVPFVLVRSRSDGDVDSDAYSLPKMRKEELIGMVTKTMFHSLGY